MGVGWGGGDGIEFQCSKEKKVLQDEIINMGFVTFLATGLELSGPFLEALWRKLIVKYYSVW